MGHRLVVSVDFPESRLFDEARVVARKEGRKLASLIRHAVDLYLEPHRPINLSLLGTLELVREEKTEPKRRESEADAPREADAQQVDEIVAKVVKRITPEIQRLLEEGANKR